MKKLLLFTGFLLFIGVGTYGIYRLSNSLTFKIMLLDSGMETRDHEPILGFYDGSSLQSNSENKWRHLALILDNDENWKIDKNLLDEIPSHQSVLLTVEMWDTSVLSKITQGKYDESIRQLFSEILNSEHEIFLRWNPEMEVPAGLYPWEAIPNLYIDSFNRFSQIIKEISPATKMVFAPSGYPGSLESYPGEDLVDAASVTINSRSEKNILLFKEKDIETQLFRKLHRLRFIDHPIFILGSENLDSNEFQISWIENAFKKRELNKANIYSEENYINNKIDTIYKSSPLMVGVYDPDGGLINEQAISIEHVFISFQEVKSGEFKKSLEKVLQRNNHIIITVEPGMHNHEMENANILADIIKGDYDEIIEEFYEILSTVDRRIYLRIAHEMEIPVNRYAWQNKDPIEYIKAYRYFMKFPGSDLENIERIWGPAGDRGSLEFWPGNDVVDYISISVYGLPDKNITDPDKQESFEKIYNRKLWRMRFVQKPVFITEFGVKGDEEFQTNWLKDAAMVLNNHPEIKGVSYFNNVDVPEAWGEIAPPQWGISKKSFLQFIETLER